MFSSGKVTLAYVRQSVECVTVYFNYITPMYIIIPVTLNNKTHQLYELLSSAPRVFYQ